MGHAFQHTLMDALTRYHRMCGDRTLWQTGTDHAGIATQMVVERQIAKENIDRRALGREAFVRRIWQWKEQSGNTITQQMRRLGDSVDWTRERFTMDEGLSEAVVEVFVRLYDEGLIYRGKRLVNWDPVLHTALSDLEVVSEEEEGHLWHLRYPLTNGDGSVVVATTRPETMLGDSAVAVHPDDSRYRNFVGQYVQLPITNRKIPIIADEHVAQDFGTGCVKITPAHDFNDYVIGLSHDLAFYNILTPDATLNAEVPAEYRGLDRFEARKKIIGELKSAGLLVKTERHKLKVPRGDRSGAILEPLLTDQWFVKIAPLAAPAMDVVRSKKVKFIPDNWSKTYFEWMNNIQDWCISRQLWWGHRIPAWYDDEGNIYVGRTERDIRKQYGLGSDINLRQDEDVLDTWFSSALWPFSTLGWPQETKALRTFYPTNVLVTGFDIIFFWVARMIMMGLKFAGDVPFHEVYITGLIRDEHGQKMSKSKGNVIDPIDIIDGIDLETLVQKRTHGLLQPQLANSVEHHTRKQFPDGIKPHGTDALRFTFAALASTTRDINFDLNRVEGYRNFCNKLWNAARYVLMNTGYQAPPEKSTTGSDETELSVADRWINSRLHQTINEVRSHFEEYRFDLVAQRLYDFTWHDYCDWYLELSKPVLLDRERTSSRQFGTRKTLIAVLEALLRLLHPLIPFITEEIWQRVAPVAGISGESITVTAYPESHEFSYDPSAEKDIEWLQRLVIAIRQIRSEAGIAPARHVTLVVEGANDATEKRLAGLREWLVTLARAKSLDVIRKRYTEPAATAVVDELTLRIPLAGLIDADAELGRLDKTIIKLEREIERLQAKLGNAKFVENAPSRIVEKERERQNQSLAALERYRSQRENIAILAENRTDL